MRNVWRTNPMRCRNDICADSNSGFGAKLRNPAHATGTSQREPLGAPELQKRRSCYPPVRCPRVDRTPKPLVTPASFRPRAPRRSGTRALRTSQVLGTAFEKRRKSSAGDAKSKEWRRGEKRRGKSRKRRRFCRSLESAVAPSARR
eukprot:scaffold335_cov253-Pinguiococcus_pyrenoidosus.AAC.7